MVLCYQGLPYKWHKSDDLSQSHNKNHAYHLRRSNGISQCVVEAGIFESSSGWMRWVYPQSWFLLHSRNMASWNHMPCKPCRLRYWGELLSWFYPSNTNQSRWCPSIRTHLDSSALWDVLHLTLHGKSGYQHQRLWSGQVQVTFQWKHWNWCLQNWGYQYLCHTPYLL